MKRWLPGRNGASCREETLEKLLFSRWRKKMGALPSDSILRGPWPLFLAAVGPPADSGTSCSVARRFLRLPTFLRQPSPSPVSPAPASGTRLVSREGGWRGRPPPRPVSSSPRLRPFYGAP